MRVLAWLMTMLSAAFCGYVLYGWIQTIRGVPEWREDWWLGFIATGLAGAICLFAFAILDAIRNG